MNHKYGILNISTNTVRKMSSKAECVEAVWAMLTPDAKIVASRRKVLDLVDHALANSDYEFFGHRMIHPPMKEPATLLQDNHPASVKVYVADLQWGEVLEYTTSGRAARYLGVTKQTISASLCSGGRPIRKRYCVFNNRELADECLLYVMEEGYRDVRPKTLATWELRESKAQKKPVFTGIGYEELYRILCSEYNAHCPIQLLRRHGSRLNAKGYNGKQARLTPVLCGGRTLWILPTFVPYVQK